MTCTRRRCQNETDGLHRWCDDCRAADRVYQRARYRQRVQNWLCTKCSAEARPYSQFCAHHLEIARRRARDYRRRWRAARKAAA